MLSPLIEAASGLKGIKLLWNAVLEYSSKEIKHMVSDETLQKLPYCKIPFKVHTDASNKKLGADISYQSAIQLQYYREVNPINSGIPKSIP